MSTEKKQLQILIPDEFSKYLPILEKIIEKFSDNIFQLELSYKVHTDEKLLTLSIIFNEVLREFDVIAVNGKISMTWKNKSSKIHDLVIDNIPEVTHTSFFTPTVHAILSYDRFIEGREAFIHMEASISCLKLSVIHVRERREIIFGFL